MVALLSEARKDLIPAYYGLAAKPEPSQVLSNCGHGELELSAARTVQPEPTKS
jgi:hypothetical protein